MAWSCMKAFVQTRLSFISVSFPFIEAVHMFMVVGLGVCREVVIVIVQLYGGGEEGAEVFEVGVIGFQLGGGVAFTFSAFTFTAGYVF